MYDADTMIIGFADDVVVVIVTKEVTQMANQSVATIRWWFSTRGLQLGDHKTDAVLVTSRKIVETINLTVGDCDISLQLSLR